MKYQLIAPINQNYSTIQQILTNRGMAIDDIPHYLHLTEDDNLNPFLLDNVEKGISLLLDHLSDDKYIGLLIDADADGFTSGAILLNYLHSFLPDVVENKFYYIFHEGKQHGLNDITLKPHTGLVIAPDSASSDYEEHKKLREQGIDVLVLDHHEAPYVSEDACVINNQLCDYPTKSLSGAGIVYKFCQAMDELLGYENADECIDLVALALVGDMMDIQDFETRYLITKGFDNVNSPFLKEMIRRNEFSLGDTLTPNGVAFYIVPGINAIVRVGSMDDKKTLFEAMLSWKALELVPSTKRGCIGQTEPLVEQAVRNCENAKRRQNKTRDENLKSIERLIEEQNLLSHKILVIRLTYGMVDANLAGLVANQLMGKYQQPVLVLTEHEGTYSGSGRTYGIEDFRGFIEESGFAEYAQGHPGAFGTSFTAENLDKFVEYADEALKDFDFSPSYKVDYIWQANDLKPQDIIDIASYKPLYGQTIKEPFVAIEHLNLTKDNLQLMGLAKGKPTLKFTLPNGISCVKFKSSEEEYNNLFSETGCVSVNLVATCDINSWNGLTSPQLKVSDYEIINRQQFYF